MLIHRHVSSFYTTAVVTSPIFFLYGTAVATVTIADLMLLVASFFIVLHCFLAQDNYIIDVGGGGSSTVLLLIFIGMTLQSLFRDGLDIEHTLKLLRYVFYLSIIVFFTRRYLNPRQFWLLYKVIAVFAVFFLCMQYTMLNFFDMYIPGNIQFLPNMREDMSAFNMLVEGGSKQRLRSIFGEPSQFGIFISGYLAFSLFSKQSTDSLLLKVFLSLGLLLSISTYAYVSLAILIIFLTLFSLLRVTAKTSLRKLLFGSVFLISVVFLFLTMFSADFFVTFEERLHYSVMGRFEAYFIVFDSLDMSPLTLLFGHGMQVSLPSVWIPSFLKLIVFFGIIPMLFMYGFIFLSAVNGGRLGIVLGIMIVFASFATELIVGIQLVLFFSMLLLARE